MLEKMKKFFYRSIGSKEISIKSLFKIMQKYNAILIDVRSKQEYEEGHLQGAINISLYDLKKQVEQKIPNKEQSIIVYCSSGGRSKQAQLLLEELGYQNVYNLKDGLNGM